MFLRGVLSINRLSQLKFFALAVNLTIACLTSGLLSFGIMALFFKPTIVFETLERLLLDTPTHFAIGIAASISIPMLLITKNFDTDRNCRMVSSSYLAAFTISTVLFVSL